MKIDAEALRVWGIAASAAFIAGALAVAWRTPDDTSSPVLAEAAPIFLLVRFEGGGPIARAQALARSDPERAARSVARELARQQDFAGLCFANFAEDAVLLRTCAPAKAENGADWRARLAAMDGVGYVRAQAPGEARR